MDILCGSCGSENLTRDPEARQSSQCIPMLCLDCGWRGSRTPTQSCPRCGSTDLNRTPIQGAWAYEDLEDARENPETTAWGYVDKTVFRCRKCRNEWTVAGEFRPYRPGE
jgi:predicted RNA-binding Zn-ribbon protein involved in translation (DUF1610 family)